MARRRSVREIEQVLELRQRGLSDREASELTGVPVNTIRTWRNHGLPAFVSPLATEVPACSRCGDEVHELGCAAVSTYCYLLGVYLGDGCLSRNGSSWTLRLTLDEAYPGIISECVEAMRVISEGRFVGVRRYHGQSCVEVACTWRRWSCLFPQHGPGRKHTRSILLEPWQQRLVDEAPGALLRGLIHTDGWRGVNRVVAKGRGYEYPRYQFSNRSDDIRRIFTDTCDRLGIEWRQWTRYHISVARREAVAKLDEYVGLKR